jgi:hypothetical protein
VRECTQNALDAPAAATAPAQTPDPTGRRPRSSAGRCAT